jgi:hypothetical protein
MHDHAPNARMESRYMTKPYTSVLGARPPPAGGGPGGDVDRIRVHIENMAAVDVAGDVLGASGAASTPMRRATAAPASLAAVETVPLRDQDQGGGGMLASSGADSAGPPPRSVAVAGHGPMLGKTASGQHSMRSWTSSPSLYVVHRALTDDDTAEPQGVPPRLNCRGARQQGANPFWQPRWPGTKPWACGWTCARAKASTSPLATWVSPLTRCATR